MFYFIQFLSGVTIFYRTTHLLEKERVFCSKLMTKIGTVYVLWLVFCGIFFVKQGFVFSIFVFLPVLFLIVFEKWTVVHRRKHFQKGFVRFLNNIILYMSMGNGFRQSVFHACNFENEFFRTKIESLMEIVVFSAQFLAVDEDSFVELVIKEFQKSDQQPHRAMDRLKNFRNFLKKKDDFRHKSGQMTRQIHIQVGILTGFYFALLLFVGGNYGILKNSLTVFVSLSFYLLGSYLSFFWGKRIKWKI